MNRVFKTKWSAAHQQYVVTDEHRATKGKASKSAVALTVAALMMAGAHAAYMEPGFEASRYHEVDQEIEEIDGELHYELSIEALMKIMVIDDAWLTTSVVPGAWYSRVPSVDGTRVPVAWSMRAHNPVEVPRPATVYSALNRRIPWFGVDDAVRWIIRMLREGQSVPC